MGSTSGAGIGERFVIFINRGGGKEESIATLQGRERRESVGEVNGVYFGLILEGGGLNRN